MCVTNNLGPKKQVGSKQLINLLTSMCVILRRRQTDIKNNLFTIHNILCHNRQLGRKTHQIVKKNISRNAKQRLLKKQTLHKNVPIDNLVILAPKLPQVSGFVCAYHSGVQGSNPRQTIWLLPFIVKFCIIFVIVLSKG